VIFDASITHQEVLAPGIWLMRFETAEDYSGFRAGAFFHIQVDPGPYPMFRRAYSILGASANEAEILYKVAGVGSTLLSRRKVGDVISVMGPLGNSFSEPASDEHALLVAGGIGMPPILRYAENLLQAGVTPDRITFIYGARTAAELVLRDRIEALGITVLYATDDGSTGTHGYVTDVLRQEAETLQGAGKSGRFYACGPEPMLAALTELSRTESLPGELSLETPMPCGAGVCLGCIIPCKCSGDDVEYKRTCIDGPIFRAQEVVWP